MQPPDDSSSSNPLGITAETIRRSSPRAAEATQPGDLVGQIVADRYRVLDALGAGGMGTVYRAEHIHMRKPVALKVLHRELTHLPEIVARFEREAIAAARIAHPNVAAATDFGRLPDGACYLVLEYVHGHSLRQELFRAAPFEPERACRIAKQIALALAAAHEAGIVHRDLKPENVMLEDGTELDRVKVLDFGIARIHMPEQPDQPTLTRIGTVFGTPEYMSPEQALGQTADGRADIYSLGIISYEMLTGRTPFADREMLAVMTRHMTEAPPPLPIDIDPAIAALVLQMLAKRTSERPQTALEVAARIDTILSSPVELRSSASHRSLSLSGEVSPAQMSALIEDTASASNLGAHLGTVRPSLPAWLRRTVRVGARRVPLVMVVLLTLATLVVTLVVVSLAGWLRPTSTVASPSAIPTASIAIPIRRVAAPDPLIKRARLGEKAALQALEARPATELDAEHWAALARGRARNRQWSGVLDAYEHALDKAPSLARDGELLSDIRAAATAETSAHALGFAADRLGAAGVDIIYDVWASAASGRGTQSDARAAKKLLDDPQVRAHASAILKVALDLNDARGCTEYRRVLPKVASQGDDRCLRTLRRLTYERGCGLFGLGDCYSCLRGTSTLSQAIEAVKARPGPTFK